MASGGMASIAPKRRRIHAMTANDGSLSEAASKARDAPEFWNSIGSLMRHVYLNMVIQKPELYRDTPWRHLPHNLKSLLSREFNRMQGRHNKRVAIPTANQAKKWGLRRQSYRPFNKIDSGSWDTIYQHEVTHPRAQAILNRIYPKPGHTQHDKISDLKLKLISDVPGTPKNPKKYLKHTNLLHKKQRWLKHRFAWSVMHDKWNKEEKVFRRRVKREQA